MQRLILATALLVCTGSIHATEKPLTVPSDSKAKYTILEVSDKFPNRTIVTKRVGSSGTGYSKRLYNCSNYTVRYLGSGETLSTMATSKPDTNMAEIISGSIADYVGRQACKR